MDIHNTPEQDDMARKLIRKAGTTEPSWDFTSRIMHAILSAKTADVYIYKPVISKKGWLWICLSILIISFLLAGIPYSPASEPSVISSYLMLVETLLKKTTHGLTGISFNFPTMQGLTGAMAAGWFLFVLDKFLRKQKTTN